jgi:hypothetical protein
MANYYYDILVVSCRGQHDTSGKGTNDFVDRSVPFRQEWNFKHSATGVADSQAGQLSMLTALQNALATAPGHISKIQFTPLAGALTQSATTTNDGVATSGVWHERVGKDIFRYEIGVSTSSAAGALSARTAHNLV